MNSDTLLSLRGVHVRFDTTRGVVHAVRGCDLAIGNGEVVALVGESGSGKTALAKSILRQHQPPFTRPKVRIDGEILLHGEGDACDLVGLSSRRMRRIRSEQIGVITQDALSALNPVMTIGRQIGEAVRCRYPNLPTPVIRQRTITILNEVGIPDPEKRARTYPHQLSGGQRQRVVIAMAAVRNPRLLIADEPTTALDVTVQKRILNLLLRLRAAHGMSILFITHDLGVVAEIADRVAVMYAGQIVETGSVRSVLAAPTHPYTRSLLAALPGCRERHTALTGYAPDPGNLPTGCAFRPRCSRAGDECGSDPPMHREGGHSVQCWNT